MNEPETGNPTGGFSVATDATAIYENGNLIPLKVGDLIKNEIAIRQLINSHNIANKQKESCLQEMISAKQQLASLSLQPFTLILLSMVQIVGSLLIALGTNYICAPQSPPGAIWMLSIGIFLVLVCAIGTPLIPVVANKIRRK